MSQDIQQRIAELSADLHHHIYLYHVQNEPVITDAEYDRLFRELQDLEAEYPEYALPDSPTQRVGSDLSGDFPKVQHPAPILSLSNAFDEADLVNWEERNLRLLPAGAQLQYVLQPKLDGLAIVITYEDGVLTRAATRGNGEFGDDVSANVKTIRSVPLRIPVDAGRGARAGAAGRARGDSLSQGGIPRAQSRTERAGTARLCERAQYSVRLAKAEGQP